MLTSCVTRAVFGLELGDVKGGNGNRPYGNAKDNRSLFQKALLPLYHWTDSKIRVQCLCVAALSYLTLLCQRLAAAGIKMTPNEAMEELRELADRDLRQGLRRQTEKSARGSQ